MSSATLAALLLIPVNPVAAAADASDPASVFKELDMNQDGQLDGIELRDRKWLSYDSDGNKEITRAEFLSGHANATSGETVASRLTGTATRKPTTAQQWNRWGEAYLTRGEDAYAMWAFAMGLRSDPNYKPNLDAMTNYSERWAKVTLQEPPPDAPDPTQNVAANNPNAPSAPVTGQTKNAQVDAAPRSNSDARSGEYRIGDNVEVFYGGQWNPGQLTAVKAAGSRCL
ncbi:MAG TPA: hypothetical protein VK993_15070 [Chthoniobacterales bacterium]|nr:hypothetical protein [Chthoniobacterales bacterium]